MDYLLSVSNPPIIHFGKSDFRYVRKDKNRASNGANFNFMSTTVHDIKAFPPIFNAVASGDKTFEVRRDTNHFEAGEVLRMREWEYKGGGEGEYSGRELMMEITYVQRGKFNNPVADGFCIMAIRKAEA